MKKYTIFTYNIGGYEQFHEVENPSEICEYIYVTDDKSITSSTWNVIYVENKHPEDNFDLCYRIRYVDMWKYVNTEVVIRIDGCVRIVGDTDVLYQRFIDGGYDICLQIHPQRNTISSEASMWEVIKHYPKSQNKKVLGFMEGCGYDTNKYKGLYQFNFQMQRRCKMCEDFNRLTYALIKHFSLDGKLIDSNDQLLGAFVLHKFFDDSKIMFVEPTICGGKFFQWHYHGGGAEIKCNKMSGPKYAFNKEIRTEEF